MEASLSSSHAPENRRGRPGIALAIMLSAQLMIILDMTVVNIALPHIQASLHFSTTTLSWVLNGYTLTSGGLLLLGGRRHPRPAAGLHRRHCPVHPRLAGRGARDYLRAAA